jgi:IclR family transcriptional regulator, acetate operon repressor
MSKASSGGEQALHRGLTMLRAIAGDEQGQSAADIARDLGLAPSTARRLLAKLRDHGLIERIGHGRYAGGPELARLAAMITPLRGLVEYARPLLKALARTQGLTAHLGIFHNDMVRYLIKEGGEDLFTKENADLEAYCTGIGKALLGQLPESALNTYLRGNFVPLTPRTLTDSDALRSEIDRTRDRGYALDIQEMLKNVVCAAVPVETSGDILVAISVTGTIHTFPLERVDYLVTQLQKVAKRITAHY